MPSLNTSRSLSVHETAELAAVSKHAVEKAIENGIVDVDRRGGGGPSARGAARRVPLACVAYLGALKRAELIDLPVKHKRALWRGVRSTFHMSDEASVKRRGDRPGPVEFARGATLDVAALAGDLIERAERYVAARERHIAIDPEIKGGTPVIHGTRMSVYAVRGRIEGGESVDDILEDNPDLSREAIETALTFAATHPVRGRPASGRPWHTAHSA